VNQEQLYTVCLSADTGEILWTQKYWATGRTLCHPLSANAAPTPASDGSHVYSFFSSNDLACTDLDGNLIWYRGLGYDYPKAGNDVGMSASPVVSDGVVVVVVEGQGESFAMGLDAATGTTVWTNERKKAASWTSPILLKASDGSTQVAVQSADRLSLIDLKSGEVVREIEGEGNVIPSPSVTGGVLFAPINGTTAYSLESGEARELWSSEQVRLSTSSSVIQDDRLYTMNRGVVASFNAETGEPVSKLRVGGNYWSTPVIAGEHMYMFSQDGTGYVVQLGEEMEVVHKHDFGDEVMLGSPAISKGAMYIRSDKSIWKIMDARGPAT
jgi:outer membrane protein assembly factor BamB